jgi:hypothetical protein
MMQSEPKDQWGTRRIWMAGAFGVMLAGSRRILSFWSLGAGGSLCLSLRDLFEFLQALFVLPLAAFVIIGLLVAAGIALWHSHFRRVASSISAILAIPVCFVAVAKVPLFDPWLWYVIANKSHFEALAANGPSSNEPKYAVVEIRDVSISFPGLGPDHFIVLIYDESDAVGLDPSERPSIWRIRTAFGYPIPKGRRLHDHFFIVDEFV